ncbi:hypothetical protein LINGRAPRIM_LOCUS130, partial [Linum grandiflorum]
PATKAASRTATAPRPLASPTTTELDSQASSITDDHQVSRVVIVQVVYTAYCHD